MPTHSSKVHPGLDRKPGTSNWVDQVGGLPDFIERIAKHIHADSGYTISHAIASAVNRVKKLAAKGNAKAVRALAQWEAKKGRSKGKNLSDTEMIREVIVNMANADSKTKNSEKSGGKEKIGAKSAGVTGVAALKAQVAAYKKNKANYSPEQQKKIEARLKSSAQRLGASINLSKEFDSSNFHAAHESQKCSRWQHDKPVPAVKCRLSGGKHLGACSEHAKEMTKGKSVNMSIESSSILDDNLAFGHSLVDLAGAPGARTFNEGKHVRAAGGRFGNKGGTAASGASNNTATTEKPQDFPSVVKALKDGQSVTLPNSKIKIKKVPEGFQVWDGTKQKIVRTFTDAINTAKHLGRAAVK